MFETHLARLVAFYEFAVETKRGLACGEAEEEGLGALVCVDGADDLVGYMLYTGILGFENLCGNFLVAAVDVAWNACGDESTIFG
jgi:hypothetical protein